MSSTLSICVLGSGSKGNCTYVRAGQTHCLIDAGLRYEELKRRLHSIEVKPEDIRHVLITHEHFDHISGLKKFTKTHKVTVHTNASTYLHVSSELPAGYAVNVFDNPFKIDDITVIPFPVSHDAADPVAFSFQYGAKKISVLTDTGYTSHLVKEHIRGSDVLVLESNHDEDMLRTGTYPWPLKQRISSRFGHLSNRQAADTLSEIACGRLRHVFLAHLSAENNSPSLALRTVGARLSAMTESAPALLLTHQDRVSEMIHL